MLLSQLKSALAYHNRFIFKVTSSQGSSNLDMERFIQAWHQVVTRHAILRTCFVDSQSNRGHRDQVVLRFVPEDIITILPTVEEPIQALNIQPLKASFEGKPWHHLTICSSQSGELLILLEINHVLLDGTSLHILVRDLRLAYDKALSSGLGPSYHNYIEYLQTIPLNVAKEYWTRYLSGSDPCILPTSYPNDTRPSLQRMQAHTFNLGTGSDQRKLCVDHGVTLSNLFYAAWGLVLRAYTGLEDVSFGYLTSGRDIPIHGIAEAVGPYINMLVCRMKFSKDLAVAELLRNTQEDYLRSSKHQHLSLADIQRPLNLPETSLFNTIISIQKGGVATRAREKTSIEIEAIEGEDPTEAGPIYISPEYIC